MMKRILMLLETNFIDDERVRKSAETLAEYDFEVHVLFPGDTSENIEVAPNIMGHRFKIHPDLFNKLLATCIIQPFYFSRWKTEVKKCVQAIGNPDIIYVHDLPLSSVGVWAKHRYRAKLVCDQHEYYTDWIRQTHHMNTPVGKIVSRLSDWNKYERKYLVQADLVVSVLEPLCALYARQYHELSNKLVHLPNTPLQRIYKKPQLDPELHKRLNENAPWRLVFVGSTLTRERRLDLVLDALPEVQKHIPQVKLLILGQAHKGFDLEGSIQKNGLEDVVEYEGRVPYERIPNYLQYCQIGLNMHDLYAGKEVHETISTKIFQYIGAHLAVITTRLRAMAKLVEERSLGLVVEDNSQDLAQKLIELLSDRAKLKSFQESTKKCDDLFWEKTSREWVERVKKLVRDKN